MEKLKTCVHGSYCKEKKNYGVWVEKEIYV